jgi:hypothetical protein
MENEKNEFNKRGASSPAENPAKKSNLSMEEMIQIVIQNTSSLANGQEVIKNVVEEVRGELKKQVERIDMIEKNAAKITSRVDKIEIEQSKFTTHEEQMMQESRKRELLLFEIPECTFDQLKDEVKLTREAALMALQAVCRVEMTDLKFVTRLGRRTEGKPNRPIRVVLYSISLRENILDEANKMRNFKIDVFLTKIQLAEKTRMKKLAQEKNSIAGQQYVYKVVGRGDQCRLIQMTKKT